LASNVPVPMASSLISPCVPRNCCRPNNRFIQEPNMKSEQPLMPELDTPPIVPSVESGKLPVPVESPLAETPVQEIAVMETPAPEAPVLVIPSVDDSCLYIHRELSQLQFN